MKKIKKPTSKQITLQAEWEAMLQKHTKPLERGARAKGVKNVKPKKNTKNLAVEVDRPQSLVTPGGTTALPEKKIYSGVNMIGIGQLHKSNAVPIFNHEAAIDIARMRR